MARIHPDTGAQTAQVDWHWQSENPSWVSTSILLFQPVATGQRKANMRKEQQQPYMQTNQKLKNLNER